MASHFNAMSMASECIDEYLLAARICLDARKEDGGCYGYPAALMLFCITEAIGRSLKHQPVTIDGGTQNITDGEPFRVLNDQLFGLTLTGKQIKNLENLFRNGLAHNAYINPNSLMTDSTEGPPFHFSKDDVQIRLGSFYQLVEKAWKDFDKRRLPDWKDSQDTKIRSGNQTTIIVGSTAANH
ncbi:MAG: hypothetical protein SFV18_18975 [Bryobacteraceae bacterium]|nr:hypothetical protein [Bryobacteraceae bacterium]